MGLLNVAAKNSLNSDEIGGGSDIKNVTKGMAIFAGQMRGRWVSEHREKSWFIEVRRS